jgi:hypothetical protein
MIKQLVEVISGIMGKDNPNTLRSRQLLAQCYHNQGRRNEAVQCQELVVAAMSHVLREGHPTTLRAVERLEVFKGHGKLSIRKEPSASMISERSTDIQASTFTATESKLLNRATNQAGVQSASQGDLQVNHHAGVNASGTYDDGTATKRWAVKALRRRR